MAIEAAPGTVVPLRVKWRRVFGVCRKCSRKLDNEGFGERGTLSLRKALGKAGGRHVKAVDLKCLGICPRRSICLLDSERPGQVLVVGPGTDLESEVLALPHTAVDAEDS